MYENFIESLKEYLRSINLENIKEFLIEFGEKLHSSNNLACLITLICIDLLIVTTILKAKREKRHNLALKPNIVAPYGLAIGDKYFPFKTDEILIGRHPACDIKCLNSTVSRYHAIVTFKGGTWYIEDMNSTYGTFINGEPIEGVKPIRVGDDLQLGEQHFTIALPTPDD
jgi:hypothetical protein